MGAFIGPLGSLIEATQWEEKQSVSTGAAPSFFTGLDGSRTAFVQPRTGLAMREWEVSMSGAHPEQAAAFQALVMGAWGPGPFVFVDPMAQVTNVLTPQQSLLAPGTVPSMLARTQVAVPEVGPMPAVRTLLSKIVQVVSRAPVVPGRPVTVSVWVVASGTVTVTAPVYDAFGAVIDSNSRSVYWLAEGGWASITITPSAGAAYVEVGVMTREEGTVACPQITWTSERLDWAPGRGAKEVVVHGLQESFTRASPHAGGPRWLDYSATVTEVGTGA